MIKNRTPLSIAEVKEMIEDSGENVSDLKGFLNKFESIDAESSKKLQEGLRELEIMKMKDEHIIKIADLLPETKEDVNKIFTDVGLDEDETNKILEKIKEFK